MTNATYLAACNKAYEDYAEVYEIYSLKTGETLFRFKDYNEAHKTLCPGEAGLFQALKSLNAQAGYVAVPTI